MIIFLLPALEIDPATTRYSDFIPLLEEKVANGKFHNSSCMHSVYKFYSSTNKPVIFLQT